MVVFTALLFPVLMQSSTTFMVMKCGQMGSELKITERLGIIDPRQLYFIYPYPTPCELKEPAVDCTYPCDVGYIMKYGGPTVFDRINDTPPSLQDLYLWFVKLVTALSLLQSSRILHGDIKPDNIVIDSKGEPHLIDFSLASQYNRPGNTPILSAHLMCTYLCSRRFTI